MSNNELPERDYEERRKKRTQRQRARRDKTIELYRERVEDGHLVTGTMDNFDPEEGSPNNTHKIRVKNCYDALREQGEDDAASELREIQKIDVQRCLAQNFEEDFDIEWP